MSERAEAVNWLIGKQQDSLWFIGSAAASFIMILAYMFMTDVLGLSYLLAVGLLYFVWAVSLDATHLAATYTRSYLDPNFLRQRRHFALISPLIILVGPLLLFSIYGAFGGDLARAYSAAFHRFAICYAFYHLARQHWGLFVLYKGKNGETDPKLRKMEAILFTMAMAYPFVHVQTLGDKALSRAEFIGVDPGVWQELILVLLGLAVAVVALRVVINAVPKLAEFVGDTHFLKIFALVFAVTAAAIYFGMEGIAGYSVLSMLDRVLLIGLVVAVVLYLRNLYQLRAELSVAHLPKYLFLVSALGTTLIILHIDLPPPLYLIALTIFHNLQYHRIVRHHNVNNYGREKAEGKPSPAFRLASSLGLHIGVLATFSVFYMVPKAGNEFFNQSELYHYAISMFFWGFGFHHYIVDSVIWKRPRPVKEVADPVKPSGGLTAAWERAS